MKKSLVALAALAATGAFAQATIDGAFRVGIKSNASGVTSVAPDQSSGNTVNFRVTEDLGNGLKFNAHTQIRYDISNAQTYNSSGAGNATASAFHLAYAGVSGGFGKLDIGRIGLDQLWGYSAFGSNGAHTNPVSQAGATENGQVRYTSPSVNGFNVVLATTKAANNTSATVDGQQLIINYANGPLSATVVQETLSNPVTSSGAQDNSQAGDKVLGFGASYDLGVAKVMLINGKTKNPDGTIAQDGSSLGVTVPMGGFLLKAAVKNDRTTTNKDKQSLGVDYALSKRTVLEANTYKESGDAQSSYWIGMKHSF